MPKIGIDIGYYNPRKIVPIGFTDGTNSGGGEPSVLQPWYDSLSVKPSEGLWTDLKALAKTLVDAGKWISLDYFLMVACMETDEQRLRPLFSRIGLDAIPINSPTLDVNGLTGNGTSSYLDTNYDPSYLGSLFTLNDCCHFIYTNNVNTSFRFHGIFKSGAYSNFFLDHTGANSQTINSALSVASGLSGVGFKAFSRLDASDILTRFNGASAVGASASIENPIGNYFLGARNNINASNISTGASLFSNSTVRCFGAGNRELNSDSTLRDALNTFFASRGLATY